VGAETRNSAKIYLHSAHSTPASRLGAHIGASRVSKKAGAYAKESSHENGSNRFYRLYKTAAKQKVDIGMYKALHGRTILV
jgi:hypothetical protein